MPRRITVAYQAAETTPMRQFRQAMTGEWDGTRRARGSRFWCAADRPETSDDALGVMVARIYTTTAVPEDACCETCGIGIRELQEMMKRYA